MEAVHDQPGVARSGAVELSADAGQRQELSHDRTDAPTTARARLQISAQYRQVYNMNAPFSLSTFRFAFPAVQRRTLRGAPQDWFSIDASYMKLHLDTDGGIAFFAATGIRPQLQIGIPVVLPEQYPCGQPGRALHGEEARGHVRGLQHHEGCRARRANGRAADGYRSDRARCSIRCRRSR